jgi:hypothetical protein
MASVPGPEADAGQAIALKRRLGVGHASAPVTCNTLIVTLDWATATDGYVSHRVFAMIRIR